MGKLLKIYLRPSSGTPVLEAPQAHAVPGAGLDDDHAGSGKRQVTILSREGWEAACARARAARDSRRSGNRRSPRWGAGSPPPRDT